MPDGQTAQARIVELFSSIQGEGLHVGRRHIFVRFFGCNLRCIYCDTPESLTGGQSFKLESADDVFASIQHLARNPHDAVSLTGGEPLLHHEFIAKLAPCIRSVGLGVYLETNGTLVNYLKTVIDQIDTIAMDIKLPETLEDGRDWIGGHAEFLSVAVRTEVFCKLVLTAGIDMNKVRRAARMVGSVSTGIPLVIQPVTPFGAVNAAPNQAEVLQAFDCARSELSNVRVIPQTHKLIGLK